MSLALNSNHFDQNDVIFLIPAIKRTITSRVKNRQDMEDLVQETLLKVLARDNLAQIQNLEAYACKVAKTLVIDFWKIQNISLAIHTEESIEEMTRTLEQAYITNENLCLALNHIEQMPAKRKQVFIKRRIEGMSRDTIATALSMSDASVKKHMTRAIRELADNELLNSNRQANEDL